MLDPTKLAQLNQAVPRYTSYPTAPEWKPLSADAYREHLLKVKNDPLSLYFHIPFCHSMCLYCACSVVLNRKPEREQRYVDMLCKEIDLVASYLGPNPQVKQLHFGGGTPTKLTIEQLTQIWDKLQQRFSVSDEIAMEIDPRTVEDGSKLRHLRALGFNRVSFGVQDTNPKVQDAVRRRQSWEQTRSTYELARELGFEAINIDLIYGLPFQTTETFHQTVEHILQLRPNRVAMFSYAKVPWLKPHQNAIKEKTLPSTDEKFQIYAQARQQFLDAGYIAIGMDHFALPEDSIAQAFQNQALQRNFQGYSLKAADHLIGMGVTSTSYVSDGYFQNVKELDTYYQALDQGVLPLFRGHQMSQEDLMRKWVIHRLMCNFELDKQEFSDVWHLDFDTTFAQELSELEMCENSATHLRPTFYGTLFIRNIASLFDSYLRSSKERRFSKAV